MDQTEQCAFIAEELSEQKFNITEAEEKLNIYLHEDDSHIKNLIKQELKEEVVVLQETAVNKSSATEETERLQSCDDWAGNIEKATVLKKDKLTRTVNVAVTPVAPLQVGRKEEVDNDDKKCGKKRQKKEKERKKKHRKQDSPKQDELANEDEMIKVRGGSPEGSNKPNDKIPREHHEDSFESQDSSYDSEPYAQGSRQGKKHERARNRPHEPKRNRGQKNNFKNKHGGDRRSAEQNRSQLQDSISVCLFYMQGKCHKGDDCSYSHDALPPMKLELCKFYLNNCCAKQDKCLYMHSEFPCKYYHMGLKCTFGDHCKFAHGKPLSDTLKQILLKVDVLKNKEDVK